jgi:hypothetical protein
MNARQSPVAAALLMFALALSGPARAAAPAGQYVVTGTGTNATVLDTKSKLTWTRASRLGTWAEAKAMCADIGATIGGTGWRLPTYKELLTLLDPSQTSTSSLVDKIDAAFPSYGMVGHWSMTLDAANAAKAWNVNYFYGDTYTYATTNQNAFKCVR